MRSESAALATEFDLHRARLIGLAYRLTGRLQDAEDAVQESWLRLARIPDSTEIEDLGAWLSTVVGRICLDRMRSATHRREKYVGTWLPEPIVSEFDGQNPLSIVVDREDMRLAGLRLLHELPPDQRLAFVLHDGFDVSFAEIADVLGCSTAAARQHASRARRTMTAGGPSTEEALPEQQRLLDQLLSALAARDLDALTQLLHPNATFYGDSDGKARTARNPVLGQDKIVRFLHGLVLKYGDSLYSGFRPVLVNGGLGAVTPGSAEQGVGPRVMTFTARDGALTELFDIANPEKLTRVQF